MVCIQVEVFREGRGIVVLQSLRVSHLSNIPNGFYESPKLKNWMCELCTFLQNLITYSIFSLYLLL